MTNFIKVTLLAVVLSCTFALNVANNVKLDLTQAKALSQLHHDESQLDQAKCSSYLAKLREFSGKQQGASDFEMFTDYIEYLSKPDGDFVNVMKIVNDLKGCRSSTLTITVPQIHDISSINLDTKMAKDAKCSTYAKKFREYFKNHFSRKISDYTILNAVISYLSRTDPPFVNASPIIEELESCKVSFIKITAPEMREISSVHLNQDLLGYAKCSSYSKTLRQILGKKLDENASDRTLVSYALEYLSQPKAPFVNVSPIVNELKSCS